MSVRIPARPHPGPTIDLAESRRYSRDQRLMSA